MINIPDRCKCCYHGKEDCYILFVVSVKNSDERKNAIIRKCPCFNCIVLPGCTAIGCTKLGIYHKQFYKSSTRNRYNVSKARDYTKWKTV